jgi:hypothetical protein
MGPNSPHWHYSTRPAWPISGSGGLERASSEIVAFVKDTALPYVTAHQDPERIRETLVNTPGRADPFFPARTIFAVDHLLRNRKWLEDDYALLTERSKHFAAQRKEDLAREFANTVAKLDDAL